MGFAELKQVEQVASAATEHWFSYHDSTVAVRERASSAQKWATLVFVHGRLGQGSIWHPLAHLLQQHFRSLDLDLPGFGRSFCVRSEGLSLLESADLISKLLEHLAGEPVVLVGHDIGGTIAQYVALKHPDQVRGVVLLNSPCIHHPLPRLSSSLHRWGVRRKIQKMLQGAPSLKPDEAKLILEGCLNQSWKNMQDRWPGPAERLEWRAQLKNLELPVLLLWGARDPLISSEEAFELIRALPEVYFFQNEEASHWPCLEKTEWVLSKVREFLFRLKNHEASRVSFSIPR
jgi:2-hydroxymuconate-semialdehyde hydrolase